MKPASLMKISNVFCTIFAVLALIGLIIFFVACLALPFILDDQGVNLGSLLSDGITNDMEALEFIISGGAIIVACVGAVVLLLVFSPFFLLPFIASIVGWRTLRD
ncbi:MAG: hypothetical protein IKL00_11715, partial [Oscillospiraceae bacterium]|nr:hypothetical protein [Oscillospiraceae bacterium]